MSFDIDPAFRKSGASARRRRRVRQLRIGAIAAVALLAVVGVGGWMLSGDAPVPVAQSDAELGDDVVLVQSEDTATPGIRAATSSFIDLRRDPMILRLEQSDTADIEQFPGPSPFVPTRAGAPGPTRLSVIRDDLIVAEKRLITTLPSSRDDFAFFQAQRAAGLDAPSPVPEPVAATGTLVRIEEDSSWGDLITNDGATTATAAVYVETEIEDTTSIALALRDSQRATLYDDVIVVLQTPRALDEVLQSNGIAPDRAALVVRAAERQIGAGDTLDPGSIVALRLAPDVDGVPRLLQMSLYASDGYLASLAQIGAGRFAAAADPWINEDLLARSGDIRRAVVTQQDVRLLDALYSAAIRNGLPPRLVGEVIVIMSKLYDLDRFATEGDRVTILFASEPGPEGQGLGRVLFVGIDGPSGAMPCYVFKAEGPSGFACYDFAAMVAGAPAGGLGGGFLVPVNGAKTSGFGPRHHPILKQVRNHNGVDWAAPIGTPVVAAAAGRVRRRGDGGGYGNVVYLDHPGGAQTRYAHLNAFAEGLRQGAEVAAGAVIGYVGTTGRSTGPHLHFELHAGGTPVDPLTYAGVSGGGAPGSGAVEALVNQIIKVESGGNAAAKNPLSTATGLGQFIQSTWLRMMEDYRPDLVRTMSRPQLLALRTDPALSREMVRNLARENEAFLRARGHSITPGRLYLAHFLGPGGAHTALSASGEATVLAVMGSAVVNANPFLRGKTITDLRAWSDRKMRGAGKGGGVVVVSALRPAPIPPEVAAYRKTVDGVLAEL